MSAPVLHRYVYFYQSDTALAFGASTSGPALVIDRASAALSLQCKHALREFKLTVVLNTTLFPPPRTVYGIIGTIRLRLGMSFLKFL